LVQIVHDVQRLVSVLAIRDRQRLTFVSEHTGLALYKHFLCERDAIRPSFQYATQPELHIVPHPSQPCAGPSMCPGL
jgi:hypothetical protein